MYELSHIDTCCSDYFRGSHLPVIQVLVDENTTYLDIKIALLDVYSATDHIENLNTDAYVEAVHSLFHHFTTLAYVPEILYNVGNMNDFPEWDLYMYFVLEEVEEE